MPRVAQSQGRRRSALVNSRHPASDALRFFCFRYRCIHSVADCHKQGSSPHQRWTRPQPWRSETPGGGRPTCRNPKVAGPLGPYLQAVGGVCSSCHSGHGEDSSPWQGGLRSLVPRWLSAQGHDQLLEVASTPCDAPPAFSKSATPQQTFFELLRFSHLLVLSRVRVTAWHPAGYPPGYLPWWPPWLKINGVGTLASPAKHLLPHSPCLGLSPRDFLGDSCLLATGIHPRLPSCGCTIWGTPWPCCSLPPPPCAGRTTPG